MKTIDEILKMTRVVPVIVIDSLEDAVPLAGALIKGGLNVLEVTLRTPVAAEAVKLIKEEYADAIVGTGSVIKIEDLQTSLRVDADFMVSPGVSTSLIRAAQSEQVNLLPGVATPSEAMQLLDTGYSCQKFFPAQAAGGVPMLKSIAGPLPQITFCPTGGITPQSAPDYLALDNVACIGGSWMVDKKLISNKNWQAITELAEQASRL